jgi:hypothetical protein
MEKGQFLEINPTHRGCLKLKILEGFPKKWPYK